MILLALNELNLGFVNGYIKEGKLPNFQKLLLNGVVKTTSEMDYDLLEPWIQWVTVQTGKSFSEHKVYRLGDIVERLDLKQIFEDLESIGLSVGSISAFNADNRLTKSNFFIPDPWTQTNASGSIFIRNLSRTISRLVNNNASGSFNLSDIFWLFTGFLLYIRIKSWYKFFKYFMKRKKPGIKAAILDLILLEVFVTLNQKYRPNYSHIFFNGLAHVQHHYMFNSSQYKGDFVNPEWYCPQNWDPILMMLETYDKIIGDLLISGETIVGVTGLHQVPHEQQTFYWRPTNHKDFLLGIGVKCKFNVIPRMSRDFLIETESLELSLELESYLNKFFDSINKKPVFNVDNRGKSLFVEIIYDDEIVDGLSFIGPENISISQLNSKLSFVAIKNGKHHGEGYVFSNKSMNLPSNIELKDVYHFIKNTVLLESNKV